MAYFHALERGALVGYQTSSKCHSRMNIGEVRLTSFSRDFMKQLLHTIPETGKILGVSRTLVYSLIAHGELERVKLRNRAMVTSASIERVSRSRTP